MSKPGALSNRLPCRIVVADTNRLRQLTRDHGFNWFAVNSPRPMPCFDGNWGVTIETSEGGERRNIEIDKVEF